MHKKKVVMMGLGYIGLPTAALIASKGMSVLGVDINPSVVDTINKGDIHIVEPDLDGLVRHDVEKGLLKAALSPVASDVFLIAVPTPFKEDHEPDISYVETATRMVLPFLREGNLFIIESTSPVGTTEKMAELIFSERPELQGSVYIAYCHERVLPGKVIFELENNDRVIGGLNEESALKAKEFYALFVKGLLHKTNARTAEMCKLVENAYRDVNIAFANELSMICDKAGINVWELIELASKHPRVKILQPGTGVGGHCIAVDPWFIVHDFSEDSRLIRQAREVNLAKTEWVTAKITESIGEFKGREGRAPVVACMGLSYKPDIDDLRESPAVEIVKRLIALGHDIIVSEPNIETHKEFQLVDMEEAQQNADIIVFLVNHRDFRNAHLSEEKLILDYCGIRPDTKNVILQA
jgi:UDP-N-acetyl-D-mannosaminuronic acid dehydrogenase